MRTRALSLFAVSTALLPAQNPCTAPSHLATQEPFQSTHYYSAPGQNNTAVPPIPQLLPAGYRGCIMFADLTANASLSISQIDIRLNDDGSIRYNWGPQPGIAGPPGLVGQTVTVNVYSTPTTWTGTWTTPGGAVQKSMVPPGAGSPWTLVATGTLTVMGHLDHSPAVFPTPFAVPVGTTGFAIEVGPVTAVVPLLPYQTPPYALHPSLTVMASAPGAPRNRSDQFLAITNSDITNQAFVTPPNSGVKTPVLDFHYAVAPNSASYTQYGHGCYDQPPSFYEVILPATPTAFDLSNTGLQLVPTGASYAVASCAPTIVQPISAPLVDSNNVQLGDDSRTLALPLGFTFHYPGGSTTDIVITSNGNIFLDPANSGAQTATFEVFGVVGFLKGQPQFAPLWTDLDPGIARGSGSVHLDIDLLSNPPVAYVTWLNVAEWNRTGSSNTIQVAMFGDGRVEYRYGNCAITGIQALVGFNPGWSAHDPGNRDISATLPFATGNGAVPPFLTMDARPVQGTTPHLTVGDVPIGTFGAVLLGGPQAPVSLGGIGMPGCLQQVTPYAFVAFLANGPTGSVAAPIPSAPAFLGMQVTGQALVLSAGSNAAGITISNPLCINIGL